MKKKILLITLALLPLLIFACSSDDVTVETQSDYIEAIPQKSYQVIYDENKINIICYKIGDGVMEYHLPECEKLSVSVQFIDPHEAENYFSAFKIYTFDCKVQYPFKTWQSHKWSEYPLYWNFIIIANKSYLVENDIDLKEFADKISRLGDL